MLRGGDRLAVFVGAQEAGIHRVAREIEIVGIAAELRGLRFGCPRQPHVRIFAIGVELVLAAAVQADDLAAGGGEVAAAGFLDLGNDRRPRLDRGLALGFADRGFDARGDVGD